VNTAAQASISKAFGLVVHFTLRPGHERDFDDLVAANVAEIEQHEPGTLLYVTHTVDDDPPTRIFTSCIGTGQRSRPTKSSPTYGSSSLSASGSSSISRLTG
jgi:hypothetical protein